MEKVAGILPSREKRYIKGESVTQESDISSRMLEENPDTLSGKKKPGIKLTGLNC